jgi:hypothetical protein
MPLLAARRRGAPSGGSEIVTYHKLGAIFLFVLLDVQDFVSGAN